MTGAQMLHSILLIVTSVIITFATRALPFLLFKGKAVLPKWVTYIGKVLPSAVITVLVVYCLRSISFTAASGFLPAVIGVCAVAALHLYKRNNLLSIGGGTVIYMVLLQIIK